MNLIIWKIDANNVTDLPLLTFNEIKYEIMSRNLIYNNQVTLFDTLEMSDSGNYINQIVSSIEFESNF